jgi:flagellar protein FliS
MKMYRKSALEQYNTVDIETKASTYSPEQLISLLFDKGCLLIRQSVESLKSEDKDTFNDSSTHAMQIILSLRGVLDMENGGELAKSLYESYTAIAASLFKAKSDENIESLNTLYEALSELRDAWKIVSSQSS